MPASGVQRYDSRLPISRAGFNSRRSHFCPAKMRVSNGSPFEDIAKFYKNFGTSERSSFCRNFVHWPRLIARREHFRNKNAYLERCSSTSQFCLAKIDHRKFFDFATLFKFMLTVPLKILNSLLRYALVFVFFTVLVTGSCTRVTTK